MRRRLSLLVAGGVVSAFAPAAMSACIYNFSTDQAYYDVSDGSVTVHVYLTETLTSGSTSFADADGGIFGVQLSVIRTSGDIGEITGVTRNSADFSDALSGITMTPVRADVNNILNFTAPAGVHFNGAANSITNMWQADITISRVLGGSSDAMFTVNVPGPEGGYIATVGGTSLDVTPQGGQFTPVTGSSFEVGTGVVPEPSAVILLAASSLLLGLRRRTAT